MIKFENVNKSFGKLHVLKNVNVELNRGECIALIGPNGCGKTTLIKCILGMVLPDSGKILFEGKNIRNEYLYRKNIGYMPQIGRYPENMNIGSLIEMMKDIRKRDYDRLDEELLDAFDLKSLYNKPMHTLSGGTVQKVSATLAFLFDPPVLILDEPTAGLDPLSSEILKEKIVKEREDGKLILITSHLLSELDDMVSDVIFMQEGQIRFKDKIAELQNRTGEEKISKAITAVLKQTAE